jgi:hypothetical protein
VEVKAPRISNPDADTYMTYDSHFDLCMFIQESPASTRRKLRGPLSMIAKRNIVVLA